MNLYRELALLDDADAEQVLQGLLKGLSALHPEYAKLFAAPDQMASVVRSAAASLGDAAPPAAVAEPTGEQRTRLVRELLVAVADDPQLGPRLQDYLSTSRETLLEPVTTALVLAGIILVLSTHVSVEAERKDGQTNWKVKVEKKPTPVAILKKFFGLFK